MKLQFKPVFWLLGALLVVFVAFVGFQQYRTFSGLGELQAQNLEVLEQREWLNAENVNQCVQHAVKGSLERGEMEKFSKLLDAQREVQGLLEFSLYDRKGVLTHSSDASAKGKSLPPELREQLLQHSAKVKRLTGPAFEIYEPQAIHPDCIRCHTDWPKTGTAGVLALRFSASSLTQAKQDWASTVGRLRTKQMLEAGGGALMVSICFFALTVFVVRTQIAGPLSRAIQLASRAVEQITWSSEQLRTASQSVAEGANAQAASLEETGASLEEMSSMTKRNASHSQKAKALAAQTRAAADVGAQDMQAMVNAMSAIKASSADIAKIIKTIDEIAFQTNILSLNAAVEAARAGDAGLGFAVVANEVRRLAQRSAEAAKETATKIQTAIGNADHGVAINAKVAQALEDILAKARQVDELAGEVATASQEQSNGIKQLNLAVAQMDRVTQAHGASAEQSASAAAELTAQAGALREAVAELLELVGSGSEAAPSSAAEDMSDPAPDNTARNGHTRRQKSVLVEHD